MALALEAFRAKIRAQDLPPYSDLSCIQDTCACFLASCSTRHVLVRERSFIYHYMLSQDGANEDLLPDAYSNSSLFIRWSVIEAIRHLRLPKGCIATRVSTQSSGERISGSERICKRQMRGFPASNSPGPPSARCVCHTNRVVYCHGLIKTVKVITSAK